MDGSEDMSSEHKNIEHCLRDRGDIQIPARYEENQMNTVEESIKRARYRKTGKKISIKKRINQIQNLIQEQGSRTKITSLTEQLKRVLQEARTCYEEFLSLIGSDHKEYDESWIEDLSITVDSCVSDVDEYMHERRLDPPSRPISDVFPLNAETDKVSVTSKLPDDDKLFIKNWVVNSSLHASNSTIESITNKFKNMRAQSQVDADIVDANKHNYQESLTSAVSNEADRSLRRVRQQRSSKKLFVMKHIQQITSLIEQCSSHNQITSLQRQMIDVFKEATICHEKLMLMINEDDIDYDETWIDELKFMMDTCISNIECYTLSSLDERSSTASKSITFTHKTDGQSLISNQDTKEMALLQTSVRDV